MGPSAADLRVLDVLATAELEVLGFLPGASNATLLCRLGEPEQDLAAVYKPRAGERPLHDFPDGTLCQREVAAYEVSAFLGWGIVPPTVLRDGPLGVGSAQLFVPHDPREHYFTLVEDESYREQLVRIATFDLIINNADRKGGHILRATADGTLRGIDHGVSFAVATKLRTVVWDLGRAPIDPAWRADAARLAAALGDATDPLCARLADLLAAAEIDMLQRRAAAVAELARLPAMPTDRRPYPWPPL